MGSSLDGGSHGVEPLLSAELMDPQHPQKRGKVPRSNSPNMLVLEVPLSKHNVRQKLVLHKRMRSKLLGSSSWAQDLADSEDISNVSSWEMW